MKPKKYRKKPIVIEALLFDGKNGQAVGQFVGYADINDKGNFVIDTEEGSMEGSPGDYIIKGVNGEFYPCKPDIFKKTYEEVKE
jgi:hypothetical protein